MYFYSYEPDEERGKCVAFFEISHFQQGLRVIICVENLPRRFRYTILTQTRVWSHALLSVLTMNNAFAILAIATGCSNMYFDSYKPGGARGKYVAWYTMVNSLQGARTYYGESVKDVGAPIRPLTVSVWFKKCAMCSNSVWNRVCVRKNWFCDRWSWTVMLRHRFYDVGTRALTSVRILTT